jgi:hypothetical protein
MANVPATQNDQASMIEQVVIQGDLSKLSPAERTSYYRAVCDSLGLNPLTKPFDYIRLNGQLTLYARRDATDQLRRIYGVNLNIVSRERLDDLYIVTARATDQDGRQDESTGVVSLAGLKGDNLANALMKAETKAKRRVTLSLVGLGWLDETEIETIPSARPAAQVEPLQGNGNGETPKAHWIDVENARNRFWAYVTDLGLHETEIHEALGVTSMHEYTGSMAECKAAIEAWLTEQTTEEPAQEKML